LRKIAPDIVVSQFIPTPLRVVFAAVSVCLAVVLVTELGPGLWPVSLVTPVFAVIVFGGLSVLGSLFLCAVIGASEIWRIRPGRVEIEQRILKTRQVFSLEPDRRECSIVQVTSIDSDLRYHILVVMRSPVLTPRVGFIQQIGSWLLRRNQRNGLRSPGFSSVKAAEDALAVLCGEPR
jgi:hypothetical protein